MSEQTPHQSLERKVVQHCAPTLAGIKPANLFTFRDESSRKHKQGVPRYETLQDYEESFLHDLSACRAKLHPRGMRIEVLTRRKTGVLLYAYRPDLLSRCIRQPRVARFLADEGYDVTSLSSCILRLHRRICGTDVRSQLEGRCSFPHEIGFFLGYPYDDVVGFIENKGENYLCCGCWKVYARERDAQECFCCYKRCTEAYVGLYEQGVGIECLAALDEGFSAEEAYGHAG